MALSSISAHIGKYEKLASPDKEAREALSALAERFAGVEVSIANIKIMRGTAQFRVSPVVKNQLLLNQEKILTHLTLLTGKSLEKIV